MIGKIDYFNSHYFNNLLWKRVVWVTPIRFMSGIFLAFLAAGEIYRATADNSAGSLIRKKIA